MNNRHQRITDGGRNGKGPTVKVFRRFDIETSMQVNHLKTQSTIGRSPYQPGIANRVKNQTNQRHEYQKPITKYTKSGDINIAYQVFGSGPLDLVYIPGGVSNIDWMWQCPELVSFLQELGKVARVMLFDKRGTGLSDRVFECSSLEERMDDIRAVMDAAGSERAILFGHAEGGSISALFAVTYPKRVIALMMFGAYARRKHSEEYPWGPTNKKLQRVYNIIENSWTNGEIHLESLAPSKADDREFMEWLANYLRSGASPGTAIQLTKMNAEIDIIDTLDFVRVPTLIMQRTHDMDVKVQEGRFLAERINGSKIVEFEGRDHLFWVGKTGEILQEMKRFIDVHKYKRRQDKQLSTLLVACHKSPDDKNVAVSHGQSFDKAITKHGGKLLLKEGIVTATFESPIRAVYCGFELVQENLNSQYQVGVGIHIAQFATGESRSIANETEGFVEYFLKEIKANQVILTQSAKYLLSGSGLTFSKRTRSVPEDNEGDQLELFTVKDPHLSIRDKGAKTNQMLSGNAFIEIVLECIYAHISEDISVEMLCSAVGISRRHLQRKLKTVTRKSPCRFICSVKLHYAKELLFSKQLNIAEISFKAGFSSPSYFSRKFKEEFGVSPSSLIKKS